jgi:hypothetical protein
MRFKASLYRLGAVALGATVSALSFGWIDRASPRASIRADSPGAARIFQSFEPLDAISRSRQGSAHSEIILEGLWSSAPAAVKVEAASRAPRKFESFSNGLLVGTGQVGPSMEVLSFPATTSAQGRLRLRFNAGGRPFRIASVEVRQEGPARLPFGRWTQFALFGGLFMFLAHRAISRLVIQCGSLGAALAIFSAAIAFFRFQVGPAFFYGLTLLGALAIWFVLSELATRAIGMPLASARWVFLLVVVRLGFILSPGFESIDIAFHVHNIWKFREGAVVSSRAPGLEEPLPVPYPPALYALLAPFATGESQADDFLLRWVMGLMEGFSPLLVFLLMRSGGASREAAGAGAATAALMPEGILVLAKGIAANILGSLSTLLVFLALLRRAHPVIVAGLLSLGFLSHLGVALSLTPTLLLWWGLQLWKREMRRRAAAENVLSLALAAAIAWLAYYREVLPLLGGAVSAVGGSLVAAPTEWLQPHWIQLGKILQNLVLKFGGLPLVLAVVGLRAPGIPVPLKRLLTSWLAAGAFQALLAVFSPVTLRFEYFLIPAVAAAAGLGVEEVWRRSWRNAVRAGWALLLVGQLAIGILVLARRFEVISVILESNRWPFPVIF